MLSFDPNQVVIYTLVFVLGLLVGGFLFTGGGRKWKGKYNAEVERRKEIEERAHARPRRTGASRKVCVPPRPRIARRWPRAAIMRDTNHDGVVTAAEKSPA